MKPKTSLFQNPAKALAFASAVTFCVAGYSQAAEVNWNTTTGDFTIGSNWLVGAGPGSGVPGTLDNANIANGGTAQYTTNAAKTVLGLNVGLGGGGSAEISGGNTFTATSGVSVGTQSGALTGTLTISGNPTVVTQTSGTTLVGASSSTVGTAGAGSTGVLNINTGATYTHAPSGADSLRIGDNTAAQSGTYKGTVNVNGGTLSVPSGRIYLGQGVGSVGEMTVSNGGSVTVPTSYIVVGREGQGKLTFSGGTISTGGPAFIVADRPAALGSTGSVDQTGGSLLVNGNSEFWVGTGAGSTAIYNLSGATAGITINNNWGVVGRNGATGTMNMSGGSIIKNGAGNFSTGNGGGIGTFNQTGGSVTVNGGDFYVGNDGLASNGIYSISGATTTLLVNSWMAIGRANGTGVLNLSSGTITKTGNATNGFTVGTGGGANHGTVNVSGGLLDIQSGPTYIGEDSQGTLNLTGGEMRAPNIIIGRTNSGLLNLSGGTLKTGGINGGTGISELDLNGTTIQATASQALFFNNISTVDIKSGGVIIDSNGFDIGTGTSQTIGSTAGSGSLTKNGAGSLSLNGQNTFPGPIAVNGGKLILASASYNLLGPITVAASAGVGVNTQFSGDSISTSSLTLGTGSTVDINLGGTGNAASAPIDVTAALNVAAATDGTVAINLTGTGLTSGKFAVIHYGGNVPLSAANFKKFKVGTLPLGVTADATTPLINNTTDHTIELKIVVKSPVWTGKISGAWDTVVKNWKNASDASDVAFADGDPVLFTDLIPNFDPNITTPPPTTTAVTLAGTVRPGAIVQFNNTDLAYTLTGAGKISNPTGGVVGLTKQGSNSLTIGTTNDFTGVVRIEGGTLNVATLANGGVASPIGAGSSAATSLVLAGGILNYTGATTTFNRSFTVGGADGGIGVNDAAANLTLAAPISATAGGFAKKGAGTLTLTAPGTSTLSAGGGISHIDGGKIVINGSGATPSQIVNTGGDLWVGATPASAGSLDVTNTTLTVGGWLAVGRGNGDGGNISSVNITGSTVTVANLSLGYANNLPNLATQNLTIAGSTFTSTGDSAIAENGGSTSNITATTGAILNLSNLTLAVAGASTANLTLSGNATVSTRNLLTAAGGNGSASTITISGTSAMNVGTTANSAYVSIARNGGTGTLTVKDNGVFTDTNDFTLGEINGSGGNGILNVQDNATINTGTGYIGRGTTNTGTVNQTGGSVTSLDLTDYQIGANGTGFWNLSAGTVNSLGWTSIARYGGSAGTLSVSGGTYNQTRGDRAILVGEEGNGTLNLSGTGIVNTAGGLRIGWAVSGSGTVVQTGGTANISANVILGNGNNAQGTYTISAGTLNVSTNTGFNIIVGNADTSKGTFNVSGNAVVKLDNNASILVGNGNTSANSTVTQTGGTITAFSDVGTTVGGTGSVVLGSAAANGTNTYNLSGGTLTIAKVSSAGSRSLFNFKGGTLKAAVDSTTFVSGITAVSIEAGGANIDSNGHNVTITSALEDAGGGGGVTKTGTGILTLAGVNTYLGNTAVNAGTLALADDAALRFFLGANGVTNHITGTGAAVLNGDFNIETSGATIASGNSWTLVDNSVNKTYGASFTVIGFTGSNHVWTKVDGTKTWTFSEATGVLTLTVGTGNAYNTWTNTYFPGVTDPAVIGPAADPDHDGNSNALEFALGGVPNSGSDGPKVYSLQADSTADADTDKELLLTIAVRATVTPAFAGSPSPVANTSDGLTAYTIQGSLDLAGFTTAVTPVAPVTTGLPAAPAGYEYRTFSLNGSNGLTGKGFLRVKVN